MPLNQVLFDVQRRRLLGLDAWGKASLEALNVEQGFLVVKTGDRMEM